MPSTGPDNAAYNDAVDYVADTLVDQLEPLVRVMNRFIEASTPREAGAVVEEHPELRTEMFDRLLEKWSDDADAAGYPAHAVRLRERRELLASYSRPSPKILLRKPAHEYVEIEAVTGRMLVGRSLFVSMFGGAAIDECKLVARVRSPRGTYELGAAGFGKPCDVTVDDLPEYSHLSPVYQEAREALDWLHARLLEEGWIPDRRRGVHWYSYCYHRAVLGEEA